MNTIYDQHQRLLRARSLCDSKSAVFGDHQDIAASALWCCAKAEPSGDRRGIVKAAYKSSSFGIATRFQEAALLVDQPPIGLGSVECDHAPIMGASIGSRLGHRPCGPERA